MTIPVVSAHQEGLVYLQQKLQDNAKGSFPFSACNEIESYYKKIGVPARESYGIFGGKSFTWYVNDSGMPFQVFCLSNILNGGLGTLMITSRMASERPSKRHFISTSQVDPKTAQVVLHGVLGQKHVITLPTTTKNDK